MNSHPTTHAIRAAALDLDGTLLRKDKTFSPRTLKAVASLISRGITVFVATGRCVQSALPFHRQLGLTTPLICCNGATVVDSDGTIINQHVLGDTASRDLVTCSREFGIPMHAFMDGKLYFEPEHAHADRFDPQAHQHGIYTDFDSLPALRFTKVMFMAETAKLDKLRERLSRDYGNLLHMVFTHSSYFEVMHSLAGKKRGLQFVLNQYGISPKHTLAIGDEENDIEMLTWVAHGVAMGNASQSVQSAVANHTQTNEQDGVPRYLELFFSLSP